MHSFYLSGQRTFGNRGCEAIVRSTVGLLRECLGNVEVLVPSDNIERDRRQWPQATDLGVSFVNAYTPPYLRYWVNSQRLPIPALKRAGWPFPMPNWLKKQIESVDTVLAIGGDNYSLDYRLPSLIMGVDKLALDLAKPVIIWGASVGPFEREPAFIPVIVKHLSRMKTIAVRETISYQYLTETLGLKNVRLMADPAFNLLKEEVALEPFWPEKDLKGILGLNISPLIEKYKKAGQSLINEAVDFVHRIVMEEGMGVLFVPHVSSLDGTEKNSDYAYMSKIISKCVNLGGHVRMVPDCYNAAQLKFIISNLRYFIGARTHATIAAMSSCVPTVSISYSVKAKGINRDIFGSEDMVLPTPDLSSKSLMDCFHWLREQEKSIVSRLKIKVPKMQLLSSQIIRDCLC